MSTLDIIDVHKKFKDVYDGYNLIGSYKLYLPYYKINLAVNYLTETKLNVLEEYICKWISLGIKSKEDICYSMGIKEDIFEYCVNELVKENYLNKIDNEYYFTDEGKVLFEKLHRQQTLKSTFEFYVNGINNEYCTVNKENTDESIDNKRFIEMDKISNKKDFIILNPRKIPEYKIKDFEYISSIIIKNYLQKDDRVVDIRLLDEREIKYSCYTLLVYCNDSRYKILACDHNLNIDNSVTKVLQQLYEQNKLIEFIGENDHNNNYLKLNNILENYEKEINIQDIDDDKEIEEIKELISDIKDTIKEDNSLKYIMNYEIREKFKAYLDTAQDSLYIISPWMNNYIINKDFIKSLENLLERGVKVRIIYGISSKDEIKDDYRNKNTDEIANRLKEIGKPYGNLFKIKHGQTHEKLVICDRKYYINGSFNFLSYSGESTGKFRNEGSTYSENQNLINQTIKLRFNE